MFVYILVSCQRRFNVLFSSSLKVVSVNIFVVDSSCMPDYRALEKYIFKNLDLPHPARKMYIQIV